MKTPLASVIILNYNGKQYLTACLNSVLRQDMPSFEIILVDNASRDKSVAFVKKKYASAIRTQRLRVIALDQNHGFAEGNNIGVRHARGKYIVLLNNDTRTHTDWLRKLIAPLTRDRTIALAGTVTYEPSHYQDMAQYLKEPYHGMNLVGEFLGYARTITNNTFEAFFVGGNGVAFKKAEFPQPFDPDYFAYAEDNYLGWAAHLHGKRVVVATTSIAEHLGGGTKKISNKRFNNLLVMHGTKNNLMNLIIFYEWKNFFRVLPLYAITQLGHVVLYPPKIIVKIRAYWWVLRHWGSIMRKRRAIQTTRKIPDKAIIKELSGKYFAPQMIDAYRREYRWALRMLNRFSLAYCRIVGLHVYELSQQALKTRVSRKRS